MLSHTERGVFKLLEWIAKYWLEVVFTLLCSGAAFVIRHHVKLIINDKKRRQDDLLESIDKKFDEQKTGMKEQMSECYSNLITVVNESNEKSMAEDVKIHGEIDAIKGGMLSVQGRAFKAECRRLLEDSHIITLNEYESLLQEHITYNNLGGNHEGDGLFSMVQAKYKNQLKVAPNIDTDD